MDRLKSMKENLLSIAQGQMSNLSQVDTHELGEVIDMIKDLEEAVYYCTITEAMEESKQEKKYYREYQQPRREVYIPMMNDEYYKRDMDRERFGKMYYETRQAVPVRDGREGRSAEVRRNYMEAKEMHQGKDIQMKELDRYMTELSHDITEMIQDASPEEKSMLQQKIAALATKIK